MYVGKLLIMIKKLWPSFRDLSFSNSMINDCVYTLRGFLENKTLTHITYICIWELFFFEAT